MNTASPTRRLFDWTSALDEFVQSVSWSPDGTCVAAAVSTGPIALLDATSGQRMQSWTGHKGGTFAAAFSPNQPRAFSVGSDGSARLWSPNSSTPLAIVEAGAAWVEQLSWAPDGSCCAIGAGRQIKLLRPDGSVARALDPLTSTATGFAWRSDSQVFAAASYGQVSRWDAATGRLDEPLPWKTSLVSLAWSPDARWIVAGTQEQSVQIWELPYRPGQELAMSGYSAKVRELAWHRASRYLATGGGPEIMVWDCANRGPAGTTPRILEGHQLRVTVLAYQHAGHLLASGGEDGRVLCWNAGKSTAPTHAFELPTGVTTLAWSKNDQKLAVGGRDGTVGVASFSS